MVDRTRARRALALLMTLLAVVTLASCSKSSDITGTYVHAKEGTITLASDGTGSWKQSGNPTTFTWSGDSDNITFTISSGKTGSGVKVVNGNLVIPPDMISGDDPVTFTRQ